MSKHILSISVLLTGLATVLLTGACVTTEQDTSGAGAAKRSLANSTTGWTDEFLRPQVMIANEVRVVGPQGLRSHVATRFDPETVIRTEKTVPEGYLQTFRVKLGEEGEIGCFLDQLEIHALRELIVLERVGPFEVVVEGVGEVYFADVEAGREERVPNVRLVGKIQR